MMPAPLLKAACVALSALTVPAAASAQRAEPGDWTAVTISRNGAWGASTAPVPARAIVGAMNACRALSAGSGDCGALVKVRRGGWIIGKLCGAQKILASGARRHHAEREAMFREIELKLHYVPNLPPCLRLVTVNPQGEIAGRDISASSQ